MQKKIPLLAAFLNFIMFGLGYLYLGKRKLFGYLLVAYGVVYFILIFIDPKLEELLVNNTYGFLMALFISLIMAVDAFQEAKKLNKEIKEIKN